MISLNIKNCNTNSNYFINNSLNNIIYDYEVQFKEADFSSFSCPHCSHKGTMVRNGYYSRKINVNCKLHNIKIHRVICKECGKSHAVLPSFIIFGDDIAGKAYGIRIGIDGNPLPGQGKLPPGAKKALLK